MGSGSDLARSLRQPPRNARILDEMSGRTHLQPVTNNMKDTKNATRELLHLMDLETLEDNLFRGESRDIGTPRVFGGQVLAQSVIAASRTVETGAIHSLHAYFLRRGDMQAPIDEGFFASTPISTMASFSSAKFESLGRLVFPIVAGANPASNHPRLMTKLVQLRRRGGKVMVINPLRELGLERFRVPSDWRSMLFGSKIADLYVQPHIGGDTAWFKAVLKSLLESESLDYRFIERASSGWQELAADLSASSWNELVAAAGVSRYEVDRAAQMIADAEDLRRVAAAVPLGRTLIETDSPYLAPVPFRGKSNEPAYVTLVAERLAAIKGVSVEELVAATAENTRRLFRLP